MINQTKEFTPGNDSTIKLLNNFKSSETNEKIFVNIKDGTIYAKTITNLIKDREKLSEKIYYYPSGFPFLAPVSNYNINVGTAWKNWIYPDFNNFFEYDRKKNKIISSKIQRKKISFDFYYKTIREIIDFKIEDLFKNNNEKLVIFCYSGGIDSLCILSYLLKKNLQSKVKLLYIKNTLAKFRHKTFEVEEKNGFNVIQQEILLDDLLDSINTLDYKKVLCFVNYTVCKRFPKSLILNGNTGNSTLLHKKIFLEQIKKKVYKDGYCTSLNGYAPNEDTTDLKDQCLVLKPWDNLQGIFNCKLFSPLQGENLYELVRSIDWKKINPHVISNAELGRKIINHNVGSVLDSLIIEENQNESDTILGDVTIPLKKLPNKIFAISKNNHDILGYRWLLSEHEKAKKDGLIKLNTVLSFLLQKFLHE
jgi:hypothetical protein